MTHWQPMTSILFLTEAIYCNIFRWIYLRKEKHFLNLFLHFLNLEAFLNISKGNMTLIADVFLKLRTPKYDVREMSKKFRFRRPFDKWHGKRAKTLLKSERQHLYHIYWSLWRILELKKSLWPICKVWGLFVNPLTVDEKYSLLNRSNLLQHFQIHLSHLFLNLRTLKYVVRDMSKKSCLRGPFDNWHGKRAETPLKS